MTNKLYSFVMLLTVAVSIWFNVDAYSSPTSQSNYTQVRNESDFQLKFDDFAGAGSLSLKPGESVEFYVKPGTHTTTGHSVSVNNVYDTELVVYSYEITFDAGQMVTVQDPTIFDILTNDLSGNSWVGALESADKESVNVSISFSNDGAVVIDSGTDGKVNGFYSETTRNAKEISRSFVVTKKTEEETVDWPYSKIYGHLYELNNLLHLNFGVNDQWIPFRPAVIDEMNGVSKPSPVRSQRKFRINLSEKPAIIDDMPMMSRESGRTAGKSHVTSSQSQLSPRSLAGTANANRTSKAASKLLRKVVPTNYRITKRKLTPDVEVTLVPEERGVIVFQETAPAMKGGKTSGQLSIFMWIKNNESKALKLDRVVYSNSQITRSWSVAPNRGTKAPNPIPVGEVTMWQNGRDYNEMGKVLPLSQPFPKWQTIKLYFRGYPRPVVLTRPLRPYRGSALEFPARPEHLGVNEYWSGRTLHGSGGSQVFGLDLGVRGWDGKKWNPHRPGTNGSKNSDYRCYGKPIYAMADGVVLRFRNNHSENAKPGVKNYEIVEGNHFWIDHGELVVLYAHFQKRSLNRTLLREGAMVKKGDFLGLTGNSGNSSAPHLHLHAVKGDKAWSRDFRPMRLTGAEVVGSARMTNPTVTHKWEKLNKRNLPKESTLIRPNVGLHWAEYTRHGLRGSYYQGEFDKMAKAGYYPEWVNGYEVNNTTYFNVIFRPSNGRRWVARHGINGAQFQREFNRWTKAGFRPITVDSYVSNGKVRYAAVFMKIPGPAYRVYHGASQLVHQLRFNLWAKQGWTPTHVSVVTLNGKNYFTAIYEKKRVGGFYHLAGMSGAQYQMEFNKKAKQGFEPVYIDVYNDGTRPRFSVIWYKNPPFQSYAARHGLTGRQFQLVFNNNIRAGRLTRCIAGYAYRGKAYFAGLWTKQQTKKAVVIRPVVKPKPTMIRKPTAKQPVAPPTPTLVKPKPTMIRKPTAKQPVAPPTPTVVRKPKV